MLNTSKLRKKRDRRRMAKLAILADRIPDGALLDKQDRMLSGLDDGWDHIRDHIIELAGKDGEWAGYPLPIEDAKLSIEPRHPLYKTLNGATLGKTDEEAEADARAEEAAAAVLGREPQLVNQWRDRRGWHVVITRKENGRSNITVIPQNTATGRLNFLLETLGASRAWSAQAEFTAMERLKTLITPKAFRYYLLVGMFLETSERSRVTYLFRKGRPTVALSHGGGYIKSLCALCLHPIGYYESTYAGSLVPTDDVIAHLLFMRADERKFWGKCNQHDCRAAEAGL